jgi:hypothetical protein
MERHDMERHDMERHDMGRHDMGRHDIGRPNARTLLCSHIYRPAPLFGKYAVGLERLVGGGNPFRARRGAALAASIDR